MDLNDLREEIDALDDRLIDLFQKRMGVSARVAQYKQQNNLPILDASRERKKLADILQKTKAEFRSYAFVLYSLLFDLSRSYQEKLLHPACALKKEITDAIENTGKLFPQQAVVACQGIEGAYSQLACEKLFKFADIMFLSTWDSVFSAIDNGLCRYGILPLENSTAGSVNRIYDLMMRYNFRIVRSVRLKVDHNLLAKTDIPISEIKEIFSHEQAINQCSEFIKKLSGVKITACENTAAAARLVADSPGNDVAAISSTSCAELYRLTSLANSVQNQDNNYTRFICISKELEIYPGADRTSLMMVVPNKPGALYKVLARFYALGINLVKLESRPIPTRDFEFMFYFDLDTPVYAPEFTELICELEGFSEEFRYLGSYSELV